MRVSCVDHPAHSAWGPLPGVRIGNGPQDRALEGAKLGVPLEPLASLRSARGAAKWPVCEPRGTGSRAHCAAFVCGVSAAKVRDCARTSALPRAVGAHGRCTYTCVPCPTLLSTRTPPPWA